MRCPSCGAEHSQEHCPQWPAVAASAPAFLGRELASDLPDLEDENSEMPDFSVEPQPTSRLIEFPGVTRRSVPQWRKELGERVREVQERKAREAAAEAEQAALLQKEQTNPSAPQLELLRQAEAPEINPVLAAALRRIARAHQMATSSSYSRTATAVAVAQDYEADVDFAAVAVPTLEVVQTKPAPNVERTHNLVVVQKPVLSESGPAAETTKPRRLIADDLNDPALSYLDSIGTAVERPAVLDRAPLSTRVVAAVLDVVAVGFLSLPVAAVIELLNGNWHQWRIIALMGGITAALMFVYATVSTALTGRTLGMRLLSLRAVDLRTGLIPTGKQSAGRALLYLLSLATIGIGLMLAFARGEGKTIHDRLTRTAVVRD
jgi:uncharacterized RDD family membrane protein YckC